MVTIRHERGPGRFAHAALDGISGYGDIHDVSEAAAEYLCDEVGYFDRANVTDVEYEEVEKDDDTPGSDAGLEYEEVSAIEDRIDAGECPWCDDYEGDGVPQHAASAHADEWAAYKAEVEEE